MDRDRSFPEGNRREDAPVADEVIYENDPLDEGEKARTIDEGIQEEPAQAPPETSC